MIAGFFEEYRFLSNFWLCEVAFEVMLFPSAEHAYQASKTEDLGKRKEISLLETPGKAKRAGKKLVLRKDWEQEKIKYMKLIIGSKFSRNSDLRKKLIETNGQTLIEGNMWGDKFWGCVWNTKTKNWEGQNHLGEILMELRENLIQDDVYERGG